VFIAVSSCGDVSFHEGYISLKDARRRAKAESAEGEAKPVRPEISAPLASYIDLHRHAAVRAALAERPSVALRVMVAHAIVGSALWSVRIEPQRGASDAITESVESCAAEAAFDQMRRAMLALLGYDPEAPTITGGYDGQHGIAGLLAQLMRLSDSDVLDILAIVMGETLAAGTPVIELLGHELGADMAQVWTADGALLDLIRDREVLDAVLVDVAGESVARANAKTTGKVKRQIIRDCLTGANGRTKVGRWVPRWMGFPPAAYTERGGVPTVSRATMIAPLIPTDEAEPEAAEGADPAGAPDPELAHAA
jgi:ParB family chromosome partitioning protein